MAKFIPALKHLGFLLPEDYKVFVHKPAFWQSGTFCANLESGQECPDYSRTKILYLEAVAEAKAVPALKHRGFLATEFVVKHFFGAMDISTTGLITQRYRMNIAAENLANIESTRTANGGPYRRKQVVIGAIGNYEPFLNVLMGTRGLGWTPAYAGGTRMGGVRVVDVVDDPTPLKKVHRPGHPDADQNGYILMPNVNAVLEMADILSATRAYEANIAAFSAAKSMVAKALELAK